MADDNGAEKTYYVDRDMPALIVKMGQIQKKLI